MGTYVYKVNASDERKVEGGAVVALAKYAFKCGWSFDAEKRENAFWNRTKDHSAPMMWAYDFEEYATVYRKPAGPRAFYDSADFQVVGHLRKAGRGWRVVAGRPNRFEAEAFEVAKDCSKYAQSADWVTVRESWSGCTRKVLASRDGVRIAVSTKNSAGQDKAIFLMYSSWAKVEQGKLCEVLKRAAAAEENSAELLAELY